MLKDKIEKHLLEIQKPSRYIGGEVVRGVTPFEGLEEDIRARYDAWCESAEEVWL